GIAEAKAGYRKIRFCAEQAKHDGLSHFWVDTCCINKADPVELQDAINSMFRWYRDATVCYVYLEDVSKFKRKAGHKQLECHWKQAFRESRWFNRGWTLQELIAPPIVQFFSAEGVQLGEKSGLEQLLHSITSINIRALQGAPLRQFNVEERLSWAKHRQTKRKEDKAYSLLGIFGIHMQANYGEGEENAFRRLEEEIRKASGDQHSLRDEQKLMLLDSLRFDQIDARHMTIKSAHAKTCKWLLNSPEYLDWLDSTKLDEHHGFLWIKGKPGTGKSTLMKFALANAKSTMKDKVVIAYFFNARGEDLEKSTVGTYRSLLLQLLERLPTLQCAFESLSLSASSISAERQWSVESLMMLLEQVINSLGESSVVCFVDALDECEEQQVRDMLAFFERIGELIVSTGTRFQVCFSSRHYPNITIRRGLRLVLEGQEGHTQDITNYVKSELKIGESKIAQQIRNDIQDKAEGVFMWVVLVVDILRKEYERGRIHVLRRRLQEIPTDLHKLFHDILTRDFRNKDELVLCIQWVLFAAKPLSPVQLYFAILAGFDINDIDVESDPEEIAKNAIRYILDASKGLTETTKSKFPKVQFIHESVRDFLLKENGLGTIWPDLQNNFRGRSHERLKQCCAAYLTLDVETALPIPYSPPKASSQRASDLRDSANSAFPFLEYAVQNVLYHADAAEAAHIAQEEFVRDFPLAHWIKLDNMFEKRQVRRHTHAMSMLYLLGERNLPNLIKSHPFAKSCFDIGEERYGPPFFAAVATGSKEAVRAFVDAFDSEGREDHKHAKYLQYYQDKDGRSLFGRDFKFSRKSGIFWSLMDSKLKAILSLVLTIPDIDVNAANKDRLTPLILAVENESKEMVEMLLNDSRVDANAPSLGLPPPLILAVEQGRNEMVKLLLSSSKVDVNVEDIIGGTPLFHAVQGGDKRIVELLLKTGKTDVDAKHSGTSAPLTIAVKQGNKEIVQLL
ncbi:hypothetical protein BKA66DRAFT_391331, partial [Pyrenochaeta sp. MPI-SDFR-AT-0127]